MSSEKWRGNDCLFSISWEYGIISKVSKKIQLGRIMMWSIGLKVLEKEIFQQKMLHTDTVVGLLGMNLGMTVKEPVTSENIHKGSV